MNQFNDVSLINAEELNQLEEEAFSMGKRIFKPEEHRGNTRVKKTLCILPFTHKGYRFWLKPLILHQEYDFTWDIRNFKWVKVYSWRTVRIEKWNLFNKQKDVI